MCSKCVRGLVKGFYGEALSGSVEEGEGKAEIGPEGECVRVSVMVEQPSFA